MAVKVPPLLHKMSKASQEAWYKKHGMEMPKAPESTGRSAAQAKKDVGEINKQKARTAAIAAAAAKPKNKELVSSSERVRKMAANAMAFGGQRPGGDLTTNRGIVDYIRGGGMLKAGRLGEALSPERSRMLKLKMDLIKKAANRPAKERPPVMTSNTPGQRAVALAAVEKARQDIASKYSKIGEAVLPGTENPLENKMMDIASTRVTPAGTKMPTSLGQKLAKQALLKKEHPIAQHMGEAKDPGEYDYEGDMAMSQLKSVITNAQKLHDMMEPDTNLPEWVQSKITLAEDYIVTAANYMEGQMNEEVEQIDEDYADTYDKHMQAHHDAAEKGDWDKAEKHARTAEKAAAQHFKATGKKIYDPGYTGDSEHVSQVKEEVEPVTEKYMGFKAVMAAAKKGGARNPAAVAAAIGRKKYGKEKFQAMAAAGKRAANEETEVVAEADEGSVPTTPKEKELATHHGDPNRITYGDVIKARLKSAAAKKMGK